MIHNDAIRLVLLSENPEDREFIKNVLSHDSGIECSFSEASTGKEGLDLTDILRCDCVIISGALPDMDSLEYLRLSAEKSRNRKTPVILIVDKESGDLENRARSLGAADCLVMDSLDRGRLITTLFRAIEEKRAAGIEQANRNFLDSFIELVPYPVYYKDREGRYAGCNRAFESFLNIAKSGIIGRPEKDISPENLAALNEGDEPGLSREPGARSYAATIKGSDNKDHNVIINKATLLSHDNSAAGVVGVIIDVTERKRVMAQLRQLSRAVEQSPATVVITDVKGNIEYVNPKFTRLTGYAAEEAIGKNPRILKSGMQPPEFYREMWATITGGREWRGEFHNVKKNGELYWESASISPVFDDDGNITHYLAVKEDITERKKAEEALRISEEKLRERNEIMEADLKIAQLIQNALLVKQLPSSPHLKIAYRYSPLEKVGGDYFSFMPVNEHVMGVFIGDVAGHGVASALFLALMKFATERIFRECGNSPAEYLARLNAELVGYMSSYFITGIYGIFDSSGKPGHCVFRFASGGHPSPVWIKTSGEAGFTNADGTIIGALEHAQFGETGIDLKTGDRVFLYTDGIPESSSPSRERLGFEEGLLALFRDSNRPSLDETLDLIIEGAQKFRNGEPADDDIVLIGIEII